MKQKISMLFALAAIMLAGLAHANAAPVINSISGPSNPVTATEASSWLVYADDPEGKPVSFQVNWGDSSSSAGVQNTFAHAYSSAGAYTIIVTATDPEGASSQNTIQAQVQPAPEPLCPGYGILNYADNVSAGDYQLVLEDIIYFDGRGAAYYDLFHGANKIAAIENVTWNSTRLYTAANGDVLRIDSCMSYYGFTLNSYRSHVNLAIVSGPGAHANQPPVITGVSGPTQLDIYQQDVWSVSAYDPENDSMTYRVNWTDEENVQVLGGPFKFSGNSALFEYGYHSPGNRTISFTVTDSKGAQANASLSLSVIVPGTSPILGDCASDSGYARMPVVSYIDTPHAQIWLNDISTTAGQHGLNAEFYISANDTSLSQDATTPLGAYRSFSVGGDSLITISVCDAGRPTIYPSDWENGYARWALVKISDGNRVYTHSGQYFCESDPAFRHLRPGNSISTGDASIMLETVQPVLWGEGNNRRVTLSVKDNPSASAKELEILDRSSMNYTLLNGGVIQISVCRASTDMGLSLNAIYADVKVKVIGSQNTPPVITGVAFQPFPMQRAESTWNLSAYDPEGSPISYAVQWDNGSVSEPPTMQTNTSAVFQHSYSLAGSHTITFTVKDNAGASTQSQLAVFVIPVHVANRTGSCISTFDVHFFYVPYEQPSINQMMQNQVLADEFPCAAWHYHNLDTPLEERGVLSAFQQALSFNWTQLPITIISQTVLVGFDHLETPQKLRAALSSGGKAPNMPPAPPNKTCDDGTKEGECSAIKPKLCLDGYLFDDAAKCGCPAGMVAVGMQCSFVSLAALPVAASRGGAEVAPVPSVAIESATPLSEQPTQLDRILAILEEIKQILRQILNRI